MNTLMNRLNAPTPSWFQRIIKAGLVAGAIGAAILAAPITLPSIVISAAGYLVTAGVIAAAVAKTAKDNE